MRCRIFTPLAERSSGPNPRTPHSGGRSGGRVGAVRVANPPEGPRRGRRTAGPRVIPVIIRAHPWAGGEGSMREGERVGIKFFDRDPAKAREAGAAGEGSARLFPLLGERRVLVFHLQEEQSWPWERVKRGRRQLLGRTDFVAKFREWRKPPVSDRFTNRIKEMPESRIAHWSMGGAGRACIIYYTIHYSI